MKKSLIAMAVILCLVSARALSLVARACPLAACRAANLQIAKIALDRQDRLTVHPIQEDGVNPVKTTTNIATYRSRTAFHVVNDDGLTADGLPAGGQSLITVQALSFGNGTIEADVVGLPRKGAAPTIRGFVGLAFHVEQDASRYEAVYLRMTNARSESQLERNHSTQYISYPSFPWRRLRTEHPGEYESYVDLNTDGWNRIRIEVDGRKARLYVNGANEPCLVVNELKLGETSGGVALWTGSDTEAYFADLVVTNKSGSE
jgi:hypothetical protein